MKIDQQKIPKSVVLAWCNAISRLPDAQVCRLAVEQKLGAGFRPGKLPPDVGRSRLRSVLEGSAELPEKIRLALRQASEASALITPLSDELLLEQSGRLANSLGYAETVAALLLDGRSSLRQRALEMLAGWDSAEPSEQERQIARDELAGNFLGLWQAIQPLMPVSQLLKPADAGQETDPAARLPRPQSERQLVLALRDKRREAARLGRELAAASREAERLRAELDRLVPKLEAAEQLAQRTGSELAGLRAQFDAQVLDRVQALLDERLLPWLAPAQALASAAADGQGRTLLGQAEQLLQRQVGIDRRYGLRRKLQAELQDCRQMLDRLAEARAESLRPLPEIVELQRQINLRIEAIQQQLGEPVKAEAAAHSNLARLQDAMTQADSLEQLSAIRHALGAAEPLGLLSADERSQAFALLSDMASRIYAGQGLCRTAAQDRDGLRNLPLYAVQSALALGRRAVLVIDGHNVLFMLAAMFRPFFEGGIPGGRARQALEQRLAALAARHPRLDIQLWFDGDATSERTVAENLRVNFSGGNGSNRADRQILAFLGHIETASPELARAVVTADRDQARAAERTGAMVMAPEELAIWLGNQAASA